MVCGNGRRLFPIGIVDPNGSVGVCRYREIAGFDRGHGRKSGISFATGARTAHQKCRRSLSNPQSFQRERGEQCSTCICDHRNTPNDSVKLRTKIQHPQTGGRLVKNRKIANGAAGKRKVTHGIGAAIAQARFRRRRLSGYGGRQQQPHNRRIPADGLAKDDIIVEFGRIEFAGQNDPGILQPIQRPGR